MKIITGHEAIDYAAFHGLLLSKYADPIEGHVDGVGVEEARDIARQDPGLIYIEVEEQPTPAEDAG